VYWRCSSVIALLFAKTSFDQNRPVCRIIVVKEKQIVGSPFFGMFPSARFPKATEDVNVLYLFAVPILVNYSSEFPEVIESAT